MALTKNERRRRIKMRIRKVVKGTTSVPRLTVFRSNKEIYAQIIDDTTSKTLVSASSRSKDYTGPQTPKIDQAKEVGKMIAQKAIEMGVTTVTYDRNGYLYHGRVKAMAEAAREAGLNF